jgi:hypothetical protein
MSMKVTKKCYNVMHARELGFQRMDSVSAVSKQKTEEDRGLGKVGVKKEKVVSVSHSMVLQCVNTLLHCLG